MKPEDRLIALAYIVFAPLALLTAVFGPALLLFPESTHVYWAWEIKPAMSAVWLGAAYAFGAISLATMLVVGSWRAAIVPVVGTWAFAIVVLAATLLHQDRFFLGTLSYYIWLAIYLILPVALPLIWWLNRGRDPGPQPDDKLIPESLRLAAALLGGVLALVSLLMVLSPSTAAGFWPWQLMPLMSRITGAWILFIAVGLLCLLFERRYIAYRHYLLPASAWFALLFVASFFHLDNFDFSRAAAWAWFIVVGSASLAALGSYLYLERLLPRTELLPVA